MRKILTFIFVFAFLFLASSNVRAQFEWRKERYQMFINLLEEIKKEHPELVAKYHSDSFLWSRSLTATEKEIWRKGLSLGAQNLSAEEREIYELLLESWAGRVRTPFVLALPVDSKAFGSYRKYEQQVRKMQSAAERAAGEVGQALKKLNSLTGADLTIGDLKRLGYGTRDEMIAFIKRVEAQFSLNKYAQELLKKDITGARAKAILDNLKIMKEVRHTPPEVVEQIDQLLNAVGGRRGKEIINFLQNNQKAREIIADILRKTEAKGEWVKAGWQITKLFRPASLRSAPRLLGFFGMSPYEAIDILGREAVLKQAFISDIARLRKLFFEDKPGDFSEYLDLLESIKKRVEAYSGDEEYRQIYKDEVLPILNLSELRTKWREEEFQAAQQKESQAGAENRRKTLERVQQELDYQRRLEAFNERENN